MSQALIGLGSGDSAESKTKIPPHMELTPCRGWWTTLMSCCSVAQLCTTLCNPMDWSMPGFPVLHHLPELAQNSCPLSLWCHPNISSSVVPFSSCLQSFPASGSFPMSQLCTSDGQIIGASASASVFPMNIQDSFPLGVTGLISLLSKGFPRVFSSTTVRRDQFFGLSLFYCPALTSIHDYWKNHRFDYMDLCWQNDVSAF